jgi:hypothetical protein
MEPIDLAIFKDGKPTPDLDTVPTTLIEASKLVIQGFESKGVYMKDKEKERIKLSVHVGGLIVFTAIGEIIEDPDIMNNDVKSKVIERLNEFLDELDEYEHQTE